MFFWHFIRGGLELEPLKWREVLAVREYLRIVIIPRLEPIEKVARGEPEQIAEGKMTERLKELREARVVLNELESRVNRNPSPPLVPGGTSIVSRPLLCALTLFRQNDRIDLGCDRWQR